MYRNHPHITSTSWFYIPSENGGCMNHQSTAYLYLRHNSVQERACYNEHHCTCIRKHEPRLRWNQKERTSYLSLENTTLQNTINNTIFHIYGSINQQVLEYQGLWAILNDNKQPCTGKHLLLTSASSILIPIQHWVCRPRGRSTYL